MSIEEFDSLVDAITAHSKACMAAMATGQELPPRFELPATVMDSGDPRDLPDAAKEIFDRTRGANQQQVHVNRDNLSAKGEQRARNEMSQRDWEDEVDRQIGENKDRFNKDQDRLGADLKAFGRQNPDQRGLLLKALQAASQFLVKQIWAAVTEFCRRLIHELTELLNKIRGWCQDRWNDIKDWWKRTFG